MRAVFLTLVLANVLVFGWYFRGLPADPPPERVALRTDAPRLERIEAGTDKPGEREAPEPRANGRSAVGEGADECLSIGPYATRVEAEADGERYRDAGYEIGYRTVAEEFKVGDWVYLEPLPSGAAAQREVERLREQGIEDLYVVAAAEFRNAISLGLYANPESVERRLRQLRELGVEAEVRARYRSRDRHWLTARAAGGTTTDEPPAPDPESDASLTRLPCDEIATASEQALE